MEKIDWIDEIKKVLEDKSVFVKEGMTKLEVIEWIVETELDKAREEGFIDGGRWMQDLEYEISGQFDVYEEVKKYKEELSKLKE